MLKKPFIIALLIIAISFGVSLILGLLFSIFGAKTDGLFVGVAILSGFCGGYMYVSKFKEDIPQNNKFKASLYYFLIQMLFSLMIIAIIHNSKTISTLLIVAITTNLCSGFLVYKFLDRGCKVKLNQLGIS